MDVRRHITAGRLSELFGSDTLETDEFIRTLGWRQRRRAGAAAAEAADPGGAGGVRRRRQRLPRDAQPVADRRRVHRPRASAASTTGPSRGPPSTRCPGSRRWRGTSRATSTRRSSARWSRPTTRPSRWPSCSRPTTTRRSTADRRPGRGRRRGVRAGRDDRRDAEPRAAGVHRRPARPALLPAPPARRPARADGQGRRDRQQQLGRRRRALGDGGAVAGQRPAPRRQRPGHLGADGTALHHCLRGLPARRRRLHLLRRAGRDHRPQRRHRLGLHQPRPGRHRPLPRAGHRGPVGAGRPAPRRSSRARRPSGARRGRRHDHGARDPARADPQRPVRLLRRPGRRRRARRLRHRPRAAARHHERDLPGLDRADAVDDRRRDPRPEPRNGLDELPRGGVLVRRPGPEPRVRRPGRPHRLPGAWPDPDPQVGERRPAAAGGLAERERLDGRLRAVRRAAQRAGPGRGLHRHREPGGDRAGLPLLPDRRLGPRLPLGADP